MILSSTGQIPAVIDGRYEIGPPLGQGGMATVYRARDNKSGATVAVKVLRDDIVPVSGRARFAREIAITAQMQHTGILRVIDTGEVNGRPYYVMPLVNGPSLHDRLTGGSALPIGEAIDIAATVADALAYAHTQGVIHRDIKPANILLESDRPILADFGIARAVDAVTADRLTESGLALGTAHYMSPEQGSSDKIDGRSDIYSLGCVLYEMLSGTPPFPGGSMQQVLARHAASPVPSLRHVRKTVSPAVEQVVMRALEKVPADRYSTAAEFATALRAAKLAPNVANESGSLGRRAVVVGAVVVVGLGIAFAALRQPALAMERNRIFVLPLKAQGVAGEAAGENAATIIGAAIDGVGPLRWVDGWSRLTAEERRDVSTLREKAANKLAKQAGAAFALSGAIVPQLKDSVQVIVELRNVANDSVIIRGKAFAPPDESWRGALRALNDVLPSIMGAKAPDVAAGWKDRSPKAVAAYLQGEAAFRRLRMTAALERFQTALGDDSLLTLAALRGAQAASWAHNGVEATKLVRLALERPLSTRDAYFARGLEAFLLGNADSSIHELQHAIDIDPTMTIAWTQLGETWTHLLPRRGDVDSAAAAALGRARMLDSSSAPSAYHLAERSARAGDAARTAVLLRAIRAGDPDTMSLRQIELMQRCAESKGAAVDWSAEARARPLPLLIAATKLAAGGAQLRCATAAFSTLLALDTAATDDAEGRRFAALIGAIGVQRAVGRSELATKVLDEYITRWGSGSSMLIRLALIDSGLTERARAVVLADSARYGANFASAPFSNRLWLLGVWAARDGRATRAEAVAQELNRRADSTHDRVPLVRLHARSVMAFAAIAAHDTTRAIALLTQIIGGSVLSADAQWDESAPMGDERLLLSQLLLARHDAAGALATASVFDSLQPDVYLLYLVPSLELRARAADALGEGRLASKYRARLSALRAGAASVLQ